MAPMPHRKSTVDRKTLSIYWHAIWAHPLTAGLALLTPLGTIFLSVLTPFYAGRVIAHLALRQGNMASPLIGMATVAAIGILCNRVGFVNLMKIQAVVMGDLHERVFNRLLARSTGYHANRVSGKLVSDALDYVQSYSNLLMAGFNTAVPLLATILIGVVIIALNSPVLGLYIIIVVAITLGWAWIESRTRSELRGVRLAATKALTAHLADTVVNAPTVKTFAAEAKEAADNKRLNVKLRDLRIHDWQRAGISGNNRMAALMLMQVVLLYLISRISLTGSNLATGIFAFTYVLTVTTRLFDISIMARQIEEALLQAQPMTQMLSQPLEVTDAPGASDLVVTDRAINVSHVTFHYHDAKADQPVFKDLNLSIAGGERIGLVGPSGGGKSTFTRLLLRFDDIDAGAITIDGQNIASVTQESLRRAIAYVPQEPLLFHRSVGENIAYGHPDASRVAIEEAARRAYAADFIAQLPNGYNTIVGERGVKLSGGQRQRIAIARAILKNAPILMLDEATSALDSESEGMIQAALWELMQDRTAIVVAHRLSTIQRLDRIIVLDCGRVMEQGTHRQLVEKGGLYGRLWAHQSGGFITDDNISEAVVAR